MEFIKKVELKWSKKNDIWGDGFVNYGVNPFKICTGIAGCQDVNFK